MESRQFSFPVRDLLPARHLIELSMGYKPGETPGPVSAVLQEVMEEVSGFEDARAEYRIFSNVAFEPTGKVIIVERARFCVKGIIFSQIKKSSEVALFICTAGKRIGERSRYFMKNDDLLKGYMFDVVGSEIAEASADLMQKELENSQAADGRHITNRFSPGYCGWNVSEQHYLFSFFPDNFCGITLTGSALMDPVKSVSGLIGIGKEVRFAPYQCKVCDDKNCLYRVRKTSSWH